MDKVKQGKKNRQSGARFERKVRADLESKGWIVDRWSNNINLYPHLEVESDLQGGGDIIKSVEVKGELIPAKSNRFGMRTTGFTDFVAFHHALKDGDFIRENTIKIIGVECKSNGYLDKEEKAKCKWLLENNIFSKILIAKKGKKRGEIEYTEWENKS